MADRDRTPNRSFKLAMEAIGNLWREGFAEFNSSGIMVALSAHTEIERTPVSQKTGPFYRHFLPLHNDMVTLLTETYRRYFKLALAHPRQTRCDPDKWARGQLQPAADAALEWIDEEELVELTPKSVRVRNRILSTALRSKHRAAWTESVPLQFAEGD